MPCLIRFFFYIMSDVGVPGYEALGLDINKVKGDSKETKEGIVGEQLPELELSMDDTELLELPIVGG